MKPLEHPFMQKLLSLQLPPGDYVVAGSGPLLAHGLKEDISDLDVVARGRAWEMVTRLGRTSTPPSGVGKMVLLFGGEIEVFDAWLPGVCDTSTLIDEAEVIQGIPFSPLARVLDWKRQSNRPKDRIDVDLIMRSFAKE